MTTPLAGSDLGGGAERPMPPHKLPFKKRPLPKSVILSASSATPILPCPLKKIALAEAACLPETSAATPNRQIPPPLLPPKKRVHAEPVIAAPNLKIPPHLLPIKKRPLQECFALSASTATTEPLNINSHHRTLTLTRKPQPSLSSVAEDQFDDDNVSRKPNNVSKVDYDDSHPSTSKSMALVTTRDANVDESGSTNGGSSSMLLAMPTSSRDMDYGADDPMISITVAQPTIPLITIPPPKPTKAQRADYYDSDPFTALTLLPPGCCSQLQQQSTTGDHVVEQSLQISGTTGDGSSSNRPGRQWDIEKVLEVSDVGDLHRLLLRKEHIELLLRSWDKEARKRISNGHKEQVDIRDVDTGNTYKNLGLKWNRGTYNIQGNWVKCFVKPRNLKKGDHIGMSWDEASNCFLFGVISRVDQTAAAASKCSH